MGRAAYHKGAGSPNHFKKYTFVRLYHNNKAISVCFEAKLTQ